MASLVGMKVVGPAPEAIRRVLQQAIDKTALKTFNQAAFAIMRHAQDSLERTTSAAPSPPGSPPRTRKGIRLKRAIRYSANREGAVIGPRASIADQVGEAHEHGISRYKGASYPERPFMMPALEANLERFAKDWTGALRQ